MSLPTMSELQSLRVVDLRQRLDVLGLEKAGLKAVLVKRLYDHYQETGVVHHDEYNKLNKLHKFIVKIAVQ